MAKTFRELLAEKDDEFTYYVRSTADIHRPELFERVRHAFLPYRVISCDIDSYKPISRNNKSFPDEPNSPTYSIKVVTGLKVPKEHIQTLAMTVHIHMAHLKIEGDQDVELMNNPEAVTSTIAQALVGQKRIAEFVRELQADKRKRMKDTTEREVYESFYTTHRGLEDVVKKPIRKGYYLIEAFREDGKNYLIAEGPYGSRPEGNEYCDRIKVAGSQIVAEGTAGDKYGVQVLIEEIAK